MKTTSLYKIIALALVILLLSFIQAFAAERRVVKTQGIGKTQGVVKTPGVVRAHGRMKGLQLKKNTMIVNEREFVWDSKSLFHDEKGVPFLEEKGSPPIAELLKKNGWVYIEGVRQKNKPILIQKLYLLPKYIEKSDMHLYPFMQ